jgi:hypothetical protein
MTFGWVNGIAQASLATIYPTLYHIRIQREKCMASVLEDLVSKRQRSAAGSSGKRTIQSQANGMLRLISMAVMALAVVRYHDILFTSAQPIFNHLYNFIKR